MPNRLADSTSPYLRQHADNPVDWWEWGEGALAFARERDLPILLSVGYAACHWCHVMAHESFEDDEVAAYVNEHFVPIKVDREERPDIDSVYMSATQAMTGRGGWPMTCLLAPAGEPFYCGTYFPKAQFLQLLQGAHRAWTDSQPQVLEAGQHIASRLREFSGPPSSQPIAEAELTHAVTALNRQFDSARGGFGHAPKFPPSMLLEFLIRHHARTGSPDALAMVDATCEAMARGGIYDQLAGGFARYAVDADWVVPHFEKMLYDNALLTRVYAHLARLTGSPLARRIALETAEFMLRDLITPEGALASALDADTTIGGRSIEGATYVWTPHQLTEVLGPNHGENAAALLNVTEDGTFEHGTSTLQLRRDPVDPAWWLRAREVLLAARNDRPQPARDDKIITSWNGLAIAALADVGVILDRPELVTAAAEIADFLLTNHAIDGRLRRTSRDGTVAPALGVADDYGNLAEGLLALHQADVNPRWLRAAGDLLDDAIELFTADDGGFFDTGSDAESLVTRPRTITDNAEPSGQSALAGALVTYAALTGSTRHRQLAEHTLASQGQLAAREPRFAGWALAVAEAIVAGPLEVAIVAPTDDDAQPLLAAARASTSPGVVIAHGRPDVGEGAARPRLRSQPEPLPLIAGRGLVGGRAAAYVCRGHVCDVPVTEVSDLAKLLDDRA